MSTEDFTMVFDLGNVVLFFDHWIICRKLAELYGLNEHFVYQKLFNEGIERQFDEGKLSPEQFTSRCSVALGVPLDFSQFKAIWSDIFWENSPVIDIIKALKKRTRLFLLSNTNVWHIEHIKNRFNVLNLFDELIFSFEVGHAKPDKKIFDRIFELRTGETQIIYVDDIPKYVEAGRDIGLFGIEYRGADMLRSALSQKDLL